MTERRDPHANDETATAARRRRWPWLAAAGAVGVAVFVLYWYQPQKLFLDDPVDEAIPTVTVDPSPQPSPQPSGTAGPAPPTKAAGNEPVELARGEFVSLDHGTSGVARVLELADGSRIVRIEGLATSNGPDLFVYLSPQSASGEEGGFDENHVNLGRLKGNQGDQNYDLMADVDPARFASVVIWCDRFNSAFGAADLVVA